jgi:hypothetical protein
MSLTAMPNSACFSTDTICSAGKCLRFMVKPSRKGIIDQKLAL